MGGRVTIPRRIAAVLAASGLILVLGLAWQLRPALPAFPRSLSAQFTLGELHAALALAAWAVFVLLDLVLLARVVQTGASRTQTATEVRLQRALLLPKHGTGPRPDWRALAAPLAPPILRLTASAPNIGGVASAEREQPGASALAEPEHEAATAPPPGRVGVRLLGPFELVGAKRRRPRLKATTELISYLALHNQGATRDDLLEALWPDDDPKKSERRFWQAATEARKLLDGGVRRERDRYLLDRSRVFIDLDEVGFLLARAAETDSADEERDALERAIELFRGEPFAGIEAWWAEGEARRLRALAVDILERAGRLRLSAGQATDALDAAERGIALDLLNEGLWRLALEAEGSLGLREAISERYKALCELLDERLGLEPDRETRLLHRRLLSQDPAPR
jgi:DNA-binding SARP family transcriptional activator